MAGLESDMSEPTRHGNVSILLLGSQMATGGSQKQLLYQGSWFFKHGYSVTAAFLYDKEGLASDWRSVHPFPIIDLGFAPPEAGWLRQILYFLRGMFRLFSMLEKDQYLGIETFTHHANIVGLPLAWLAGVPNRVGSHRGGGFSAHGVERINAIITNSPMTTCFVVVSEGLKRDAVAEGIRPERMVKIGNGIDLTALVSRPRPQTRMALGIGESDSLLLNVGRLTYQKGQSALLRALPAVLAQFPNTFLGIAGDGPLRAGLEADAVHLGVEKQVKFLGRREDVPALLAAADLFMFSSRYEGMPNAVLEAMGSGLPVISTAVQGAEELIQDGENGLIVPVDDPAAFAEAILRLLKNPEERRRLGEAARTTIQKEYTLDTMCVQYEQLLTKNGT